jgi:hypothetical protein
MCAAGECESKSTGVVLGSGMIGVCVCGVSITGGERRFETDT